jgi:hypothetical protein
MSPEGIPESRIVMKTRGSGVVYEHPLVHYPQPMFEMNYGWYSHFYDVIQASRFSVVKHLSVPFNTLESI